MNFWCDMTVPANPVLIPVIPLGGIFIVRAFDLELTTVNDRSVCRLRRGDAHEQCRRH
jgi:hypothetical protein